MKPGTSDQQDQKKFKKKYSKLKKCIKKYIYENAALCDQVCQLQEKIICLQEERCFLLRKHLYLEGTPKTASETSESVNLPSSVKSLGKKRDAAWEKLKGRKTSANVKRKTIVPVAVDSSGLPVFPVVLGTLSVFSLGELVTDRLSFHEEDLVFPLNFCSTRVYGALADPSKPCVYTCMVIDGGAGPLFQITRDGDQQPTISGDDINAVHVELLRRINSSVGCEIMALRGRGADFFGLSNPTILNLLQSSPGIKRCVNYKMSKFEINKTGEPYVEENDPSLTFESLQKSITLARNQMEELRQHETLDSTTTLRDLLNS